MKIKTSLVSSALLLILLLISLTAQSKNLDFQDVDYTFNQQKNEATVDAFHFLRSYVDYFFQLVKANEVNLKSFKELSPFQGWCVGDAHPENFGTLIQKDGSVLFSMNDMDDFGPCPVSYDLYRLMVAAQLYDKKIDLQKIVQNYLVGLQNDPGLTENNSVPDNIRKMIQESESRGFQINPKKIQDHRIIRDPQMTELDPSEKEIVSKALTATSLGFTKEFKIEDIVSTSKVGGGSGGLLRYEILISDNNNLFHIELKEQVIPSIYPVATAPIPELFSRIQKALFIEQGNRASSIYTSLKVNGRNMLVRPKYWGNMGITLSDNSKTDNESLIDFEALILGQIHSKTIQNKENYIDLVKKISAHDFEQDTQNMADIFEARFSAIKK